MDKAAEIVKALEDDARVSQFPAFCRLSVVESMLADTPVHHLREKATLGRIISLGEHWLRTSLWSDYLTTLGSKPAPGRQNVSSSNSLLGALDAIEQRSRSLRRCLYDEGWATTFLANTLRQDGAAREQHEAGKLTIGCLLLEEPAVFILVLAPKAQ